MNPISRILRVPVVAVFLAASAFGSAVPGTTKVVVPVGTHLSDQDFASVGAARMQDYEAFRVYRVPSAALAKLQAAAAAVGEAVEVHKEWDTVIFRNLSIDTGAATAGNVAIDPAGTNALQLYVVQFSSPLTSSDEQLFTNAGAHDLGYIPNNAVLVAARGRALAAALASASRVQWVSAYDRSLKPSLPGTPLAADEFVVQFATTVETMPHIQAFLSSHQVLQVSSYLQYTNVRVRLSLSEASATMDDPYVVVVEPAGRAFLSGEREAISTTSPFATSTVYQTVGQPFRLGTPDYRNWLPAALVTAAGSYRVAIADSGVDRGACTGARHPDLLNTILTQDYTGGCGSDQLGHGTMVAGFAVANPTTAATDPAGTNGTFNYAMGTAPPVQIFNQRIFDQNGAIANTPGGELTWANDAYLNGSVAQKSQP